MIQERWRVGLSCGWLLLVNLPCCRGEDEAQPWARLVQGKNDGGRSCYIVSSIASIVL
jgi:hypothetical protein